MSGNRGGYKDDFFFFPYLVISVASAETAQSWGLIWWPGLDSSEGITPQLFTAWTGTVEWNIYIYIYIYIVFPHGLAGLLHNKLVMI